MYIPEHVEEAIASRFGGRFRLRWSDVNHVYFYEQKVRRGLAEGFAPLAIQNAKQRKLAYENLKRAADGYILTMQIAAGTSVECPHCGGKISVPAFKWAQSYCAFCKKSGRHSVFNGGYWPIGDTLLDELDRLDPDRGGMDRTMSDHKKAEDNREFQAEYNFVAPAEAAYREEYRKLVGIPQTGLSGATKMWQNAPESKQTWKG